MCTNISVSTRISGSGRGAKGWFPVSQANVGFDHPSEAPFEHAVLLDFVNPALGIDARVAVEIDLPSAKALVDRMQAAIAEAERSGVA